MTEKPTHEKGKKYVRAKINGFGIGWLPPIIYAKVVAIKYLPFYIDFRVAVVGKTDKTASTPGFGGIECHNVLECI